MAVEDLVALLTLDTDSILTAICERHNNLKPYTMCSGVLISVNPQQWLALYALDDCRLYMAGVKKDAHPYKLAARALNGVRHGEAHTMVITGESGAGKTEMAKICLDFVSSFTPDTLSSERIARIQKSGKVLEYIGNAQTVRNNNSSRFGKFLTLFFDRSTQVGASIQTYLLEHGRIANSNPQEGTFRVVYALLNNERMRDTFALHAIDRTILGCVEAGHPTSWDEFKSCLAIAGFDETMTMDIASMVAGAIFLLTRDFASASQIFGLDTIHLTHVLGNRRTKVMDETIWSECTKDDIRQRSKALAMALYTRMFSCSIRKLNEFIGGIQTGTSLNVLDIFGFEALGTNGLEQLCINYCNEKIQAIFIEDVVVRQQLEYANEGVDCSHIRYDSETRVIDLCERCVFPRLDEATRLRTSAERFVEILSAERPVAFSVPLVRNTHVVFTIAHYAKPVTYNADVMIDRNTNAIRSEIVEVMASATNTSVASLFSDTVLNPIDGKMWTSSIAAKFCEQMEALTRDVGATHALYIRCVRPNESLTSLVFDKRVVEEQIAANGILEACKVMRNGYEFRMTHECFARTFPRAQYFKMPILKSNGGHWGKSMVYMSADCHDRLLREEACLLLQSRVHRVLRRGQLRRLAAVKIQRAVRRIREERQTTRTSRAARVIQIRIRRHNAQNLARWKQFDEIERLKAHIVELRKELKQKNMWIFRATQVLRHHLPEMVNF